MRTASIFFKLNVLFGVALGAVLLAGGLMLRHLDARARDDLRTRSRLILHTWRTERALPTALIRELGLVEVPPPQRRAILEPIRRRIEAARRHGRRARLGGVTILPTPTETYVWLRARGSGILLRDATGRAGRLAMPAALVALTVLLLGAVYGLLRRSLLPIRRLEEDIRRFGAGDPPAHARFSTRQDEIARVGNAFYASARRTEELIRSRQLFVRNIFHELNTPVTKGKILAELVEEPKTQSMLDAIFSRLAGLLRELAQMEQILSSDTQMTIRPVRVIELIDQARDLLYLDEPIPTAITDEVVEVDFAMMSLAYKNLIDNARKYAHDLTIRATEEGIDFVSRGEPMAHDLSYYIEPFAASDAPRTSGFGLGLYIVHAIAQKHHAALRYRYASGTHIFTIGPAPHPRHTA